MKDFPQIATNFGWKDLKYLLGQKKQNSLMDLKMKDIESSLKDS